MPRPIGSLFKSLFTLAVLVYVAALAAYLLLRLLFGDRFWWLSLANTFAYFLFLPLLALLPGALLLRMRSNVLRLAPLALIGGLWIAPYYLPRTLPAPDGTSLRVLTFNVWGNNHDLSGVEAWLRGSGADVLLLQEISPAYATDRLSALADLYPYQYAQPDHSRWGGNITLSRYPILNAAYIDMGTPNSPNPLRLLVDVNGQPVAVYNVHLAFPAGDLRLPLPRRLNTFTLRVAFGFDDSIRNRQINDLLAHLQGEPYPYIVGGDFNTSDQSATYGELAAQMNDSFREAGRGLGGSWPVSSARGLPRFIPPLIRIDYIWHSDHFRAVEAYQTPPLGSDHLGLVATLSLSPAL